MRKVVLTGLVAAIIIAVAGYSLVWWMQANHARKIVEDAVARLNTPQQVLTYEAITAGGFPFSMRIDMVRPHFSGRVDQWLRQGAATASLADAGSIAVAGMIERLPEWQEDIRLDGRISFSINLFSDLYKILLEGNAHSKGTIGGQTFELATTQEGVSTCELKLTRDIGSFLDSAWDFGLLTHSGLERAVRDLRGFACEMPARQTVDAVSGEPVMRSGPSHFRLATDPNGAGLRRIDFSMLIKDSEILPRMDSIIDAYMKSIAQEAPGSDGLRWSIYGKQNVEIQLSYNGPEDASTDNKDVAISFEVPRFLITNALYQVNMSTSLYNEAKGENRAVRLNFRGDTSTTEAYYAQTSAMVRRLISEIYAESSPQDPSRPPTTLPESLKKIPPDELYTLFEPVIPRLHEFGTISQSTNVSFQGKRDYTSGATEIADFSFNTQPYGLRMNGNMNMTAGSPVPLGALAIQWRGAIRMLDDLFSYMARLERAVSVVDAEQAKQFHFDPAFVVSLKSFLAALAAGHSPDPDTLVFNINADSANTLTVNGKSVAELSQLYAQYFAPPADAAQPVPAPQ